MTNAETVRAFIAAFNERNLDAFVATLHPDVEIHGMRGLRRGLAEAREWATRPRGGVQQRILVDDVREVGDHVVALIVREWWWDEGEEHEGLAGRDEMAWLFRFERGRVREWRPFDDRAQVWSAL